MIKPSKSHDYHLCPPNVVNKFLCVIFLSLLTQAIPALAEGQASDEKSPTLAFFEREHSMAPVDGVVIYLLARQHDREGRPEDAVQWLRKLIPLDWRDMVELDDFPASAGREDFKEVVATLAKQAHIVNNAQVIAKLELPGLYPEGTAWDPKRREILLSSGQLRKIVGVDEEGNTRDIVTEGQDGLLAVLGMEVDDKDQIWVANAAAPFMINATEKDTGRTALHAFNLETGELVGRWYSDVEPGMLNDLEIASNGMVYVTASVSGRVIRLDPATGEWKTVSEGFVGANGIALSADESALFIAHFAGITRVELATGNMKVMSTPPGIDVLRGIDGLEYYNNGLIALQNLAGLARVWHLSLDETESHLVEATILEAGNPLFRNPTTGVVADQYYMFIADPKIERPETDRGPSPDPGRYTLMRIPLSVIEDDKTASDTESLRAASDSWWAMWNTPQSVDLDLVGRIRGDAIGYGYYGDTVRQIDDLDAWKVRISKWLATLKALDYRPMKRQFRILGDTGLEWGQYYERQVTHDGTVTREVTGRYSKTWVRHSELGWKMVSFHRSALPMND